MTYGIACLLSLNLVVLFAGISIGFIIATAPRNRDS